MTNLQNNLTNKYKIVKFAKIFDNLQNNLTTYIKVTNLQNKNDKLSKSDK